MAAPEGVSLRPAEIATYFVVAVELISIILKIQMWDSVFCWLGIGLAMVVVLLFLVSV